MGFRSFCRSGGGISDISAKQLQLDVGFAPRLPSRLLGDPARLRQILANLLNNAVKFTEVGRISLHLSMVEHSRDQVTVND
ncbi:ATP-binding protein [Pseudomonas fluorescens]|uniref:ATP-binding protein n=1 Tax=Pseudomonas fluorescens TaxID=294 RepID=UPI000B0CCE8D|nr:ATP-binding protein [Pseudomonas fluorescens]